MTINNTLSLILMIIFIILIILFHIKKMTVLKFFIGTFFGFISTIYFARIFLEQIFNNLNIYILNFLTINSKNIIVTNGSNIVELFSGVESFKYYLNHESSAIIETLVFINILIFYPIFIKQPIRKLITILIGFISIILFNVFRILIMSNLMVLFGFEYFFIINIVFSRIIFIILNIALFYSLITYPHLEVQKAGTYNLKLDKEYY